MIARFFFALFQARIAFTEAWGTWRITETWARAHHRERAEEDLKERRLRVIEGGRSDTPLSGKGVA